MQIARWLCHKNQECNLYLYTLAIFTIRNAPNLSYDHERAKRAELNLTMPCARHDAGRPGLVLVDLIRGSSCSCQFSCQFDIDVFLEADSGSPHLTWD